MLACSNKCMRYNLLRFAMAALIGVGVFASATVTAHADTGSTSAAAISVTEQYLLQSVNQERAAIGLAPVEFDPELQRAAHQHALQMVERKLLSHQLDGESDLSQRCSSAGAHFSRVTENVATGPSIITMHEALMHSEHHRDNILDAQVNTLGVAVVEANGALWAVEDFSHSVQTLSLDQQEAKVSSMLHEMRLEARPSQEARTTCTLRTGFAGPRPAMTVHYSTGDLSSMPEQLRARLATVDHRNVAVGACSDGSSAGSFASYNIAILVYR